MFADCKLRQLSTSVWYRSFARPVHFATGQRGDRLIEMPNWAAFLKIVAVGRFVRLAMVSRECDAAASSTNSRCCLYDHGPIFVCRPSPSFPLRLQPSVCRSQVSGFKT